MPGITYNLNIPLATNNPSVDQPNMKINTNAIDSLLQVDHISFNTTNGGQHLQLNFPSVTTQSAPASLASVAYTTAGTANTGAAEFFLKNSSATLLLSSIKAFGILDATTASVLNGFNCTGSVVGRTITITMPSGVVTGTNYAVLVSSSTGVNDVYSITSSTQFALGNTSAGTVSFAVLQL